MSGLIRALKRLLTRLAIQSNRRDRVRWRERQARRDGYVNDKDGWQS